MQIFSLPTTAACPPDWNFVENLQRPSSHLIHLCGSSHFNIPYMTNVCASAIFVSQIIQLKISTVFITLGKLVLGTHQMKAIECSIKPIA